MDFRRRLSGVFASESARAIFSFLEIMFVVAATLLFSATIVAAYTGDWNLPGAVAYLILFVAAFAIFMLIRLLFLFVLFFWPVLIAIIVIWAGHRVLLERSKKAKNEA
jgi:predicted membrane protein